MIFISIQSSDEDYNFILGLNCYHESSHDDDTGRFKLLIGSSINIRCENLINILILHTY
jgi:hypothetical protein